MAKYILNIKTGKVHSGITPCAPCRRSAEGNKKYFDDYEQAVNFFEGKTEKGRPCDLCLKEKTDKI